MGDHPDGGAITFRDGRYGPYVNWGKVNATLPKGKDPQSVTLEEAMALIVEKGGKAASGSKRSGKAAKASAGEKTASKTKAAAKSKAARPKAKSTAKTAPKAKKTGT